MEDIFIALDFPTWDEAQHFLTFHSLEAVPVKVGMELFYREGPEMIAKLKEKRHPIFLDLKLHDIPTTVYRAMKNIAKLEVDIVNIHAFGGSEMIKRAKEGLYDGSKGEKVPQLIAVTLLTSFHEQSLSEEFKINESMEQYVVHLAELAKNNGSNGVVCSVHEVPAIKKSCGEDFLTITPGIRLEGTNEDDQKRIATPEMARQYGADKLVIGRSITRAKDPYQMYERAIKEWKNASFF